MHKHVSLDGTWQFALDPNDRGKKERWYSKSSLPKQIKVPGCWQAQGFGGEFKHAISQMGHPALQVERHGYRGTGWYLKTFRVPDTWDGRRVWLQIGGVHQHAEFWCNGSYVGKDPGGLLEFKLDVTKRVRAGQDNVLAVRVFEKDRDKWGGTYEGGVYCWATVWSGLYRSVSLHATGEAWIENVTALPNLAERKVRVTVDVGCGRHRGRNVGVCVKIKGPDGWTVADRKQSLVPSSRRSAAKATIAIPRATPWSLEDPQLYTVDVSLVDEGSVLDKRSERFGMRDIEARNRQLTLNGSPVFLRGFGFNAIFPRTLSPDLDRKFIRKQFLTARAFGFNGIDFYGVPYREFLDVADEVGMLLQVFPGDIMGTALSRPAHLEAMMRQVMNHPCIICYGWSAEHYGNEPEFIEKLDELYAFAKKLDPTRLVLGRDGSHLHNFGRGKSDFEEPACCYRTCYPDKMLRDATDKPVLLHELGWFSSYPNPKLKRKYRNTALLPFHITFAEEVAERQGVRHLLADFVRISERQQATERRLAFEGLRKVSSVKGFHLWLGHDTVSAVEGVWDDFGDSKNVAAEEFLTYNGDTVLLMDQDFRGQAAWVVPPDDAPETNPHDITRDAQGRNLWDGETLKAGILVSHYGKQPLKEGTLSWTLKAAPSGRLLAKGRRTGLRARRYMTSRLAEVKVRIPRLTSATKMVLAVDFEDGDVKVSNAWDFWGFPRKACPDPRKTENVYVWGKPGPREYGRDLADVVIENEPFFVSELPAVNLDHPLIVRSQPPGRSLVVSRNALTNGLIDYLEGGGRVWLLTERLFPEYFHRVRSIPWHQSPFGNSGIMVQDHPCLEKFPHEGCGDLQLYDLVRTTTAKSLELGGVVNLDVWPVRIEPIIRSIDSYMGARRRGLLFEARVGKGRLMVSRLNFVDTPAARFLAGEIVRYMQSAKCKPRASVPGDFLRCFVRQRG